MPASGVSAPNGAHVAGPSAAPCGQVHERTATQTNGRQDKCQEAQTPTRTANGTTSDTPSPKVEDYVGALSDMIELERTQASAMIRATDELAALAARLYAATATSAAIKPNVATGSEGLWGAVIAIEGAVKSAEARLKEARLGAGNRRISATAPPAAGVPPEAARRNRPGWRNASSASSSSSPSMKRHKRGVESVSLDSASGPERELLSGPSSGAPSSSATPRMAHQPPPTAAVPPRTPRTPPPRLPAAPMPTAPLSTRQSFVSCAPPKTMAARVEGPVSPRGVRHPEVAVVGDDGVPVAPASPEALPTPLPDERDAARAGESEEDEDAATCGGECGALLRDLALTADSLALRAPGRASHAALASPARAAERVRAALNAARARIDTLQGDALRLRGELHRAQDDAAAKAAAAAVVTEELEGLYAYVARLEAAKDELGGIKERISTKLEATEGRVRELEAKLASAAEEVGEKRRMLAELGFWEPIGRRDDEGHFGTLGGQRWDTDTIRALCEAALAKMEAVASEGKDLVPRELDSLRALLATLQDNLHSPEQSTPSLQRSPSAPAARRAAAATAPSALKLGQAKAASYKGRAPPQNGSTSGASEAGAGRSPGTSAPRAPRRKVRPSLATLLGTPIREGIPGAPVQASGGHGNPPPLPSADSGRMSAAGAADARAAYSTVDVGTGQVILPRLSGSLRWTAGERKAGPGAGLPRRPATPGLDSGSDVLSDEVPLEEETPRATRLRALQRDAESNANLDEMQTLHISTQLLCNTLQAEMGHKERKIGRLESEVKRLRQQAASLHESNAKLTQELADAFANLKFLTANIHVLQEDDPPGPGGSGPRRRSPVARALLTADEGVATFDIGDPLETPYLLGGARRTSNVSAVSVISTARGCEDGAGSRVSSVGSVGGAALLSAAGRWQQRAELEEGRLPSSLPPEAIAESPSPPASPARPPAAHGGPPPDPERGPGAGRGGRAEACFVLDGGVEDRIAQFKVEDRPAPPQLGIEDRFPEFRI